MNLDSNDVITLLAEFCFALIFLRTLWGYARSGDPVQRDVMLVFVAAAALFVVDMVRRLGGTVPTPVLVINTMLLMLQPYLTLRLAARLRSVPRWLDAAVLVAYVTTAVPLLLAPRPLPRPLALLVVVVFVVTELAAATVLGTEARRRTGPSAARLACAAWATVFFAAAVAILVLGSTTDNAFFGTFARVLALLSALGYLVAFVPPPLLQRVWSATAWHVVSRDILNAPAAATSEEIWRRYADVVRRVCAADAVAVLVRTPEGCLTQPAYTGFAGAAPAVGYAEVEAVLAARQPIALSAPDGPAPVLRAHYVTHVGSRYLTALPLVVPPNRTGALLIFSRHRGLFSDHDLRLMADLGGQAGILAERGQLLAEQRRLGEELTASVTALTKASQAKSDFLASMSHELRTPLNAIIGFSDLMRGEPLQDTHRLVPADWVDHILSSGRHLLGLINDVLDLAKVEAGRLDLQPVALRVDEAATELLTALRPLVDRKRLLVELDVPGMTAYADPVRFRQILENLLSNAIKFTPEGGRITVTGVAEHGNVLVAVADTGVGIAPADQARVFEEFQQVGDPGQRQAGTGLGLALTKRLAQAHGGDITLQSELGQGSQFTVCLPAAAPTAAAAQAQAEVAADRGHVLLIEDDLRAAELVRTYLVNAGYHVDIAASGEAGIAAARRRHPDAVLLDVVLPGIQGWEVLRRLKTDPDLAHIPVFLVTVVDDRRAGLALGAAEYFVKPVDHGRLLASLAQHVLQPQERTTASVLVVDPDDHVRETVERRLRDAGAEVVTCTDGRRGLELSREHHFDLIVCDMQRVDVDGFALLGALQDDPATRGTPVFAFSPDTVDADGEHRVTGRVLGTAVEGTAAWQSLMTLARHGTAADAAVDDRESVR